MKSTPISISAVQGQHAFRKDQPPSPWQHFHDIELNRKDVEIKALEQQLAMERKTVENLRYWLKLSVANRQALVLGNVVGWLLVLMLLTERLWQL